MLAHIKPKLGIVITEIDHNDCDVYLTLHSYSHSYSSQREAAALLARVIIDQLQLN